MAPIAWYGKRLLCEGRDGRIYLERKNAGWLSRWLFWNLPREDANGNKVGYGPAE